MSGFEKIDVLFCMVDKSDVATLSPSRRGPVPTTKRQTIVTHPFSLPAASVYLKPLPLSI